MHRSDQGLPPQIARAVFRASPEADFLEVTFDQREGYFRETEQDEVMEKIDTDGHVLGFSIQNVSKLRARPLEFALHQ